MDGDPTIAFVIRNIRLRRSLHSAESFAYTGAINNPMSSILFPFIVFWAQLTTSFSVQLFVVSSVVLFIGLLLLTWLNAHHLAFLNTVPISAIEKTHPHLPSFRTIVVIFLCSVVLLAVALQTMVGLPPFSAPFYWLYLAGFFILSGTVGILCELQWQGTRDIAFAVITGTVIAFLFLVFKAALLFLGSFHAALLFFLLLFSGALAWRDLYRDWSMSVQAITITVFILWVLLYII